jgi:hypothetical protein
MFVAPGSIVYAAPVGRNVLLWRSSEARAFRLAAGFYKHTAPNGAKNSEPETRN